MKSNALNLEAIKARLAAATPGPWDRDGEEEADDYGWSIYSNQNRPIASSDSYMDADLIGNAPADLAALVAEVERLRAQMDELVNPEKAELVSFVDGAFTFRSEVFRTLLAGLLMMADKAGAENYCQIEVAAGTRDAVILTIQRKAGKTPHDLRCEAEAELARVKEVAEAKVNQLLTAINTHRSYHQGTTQASLFDEELWEVLNA